MKKQRIRCAFCSNFLKDVEAYASHIEESHMEQMIPGMSGMQFLYYMKTKKSTGSCIVCKEPTTWNEKTGKYNRFCENPNCKNEYRLVFQQRMLGKYGKVTLLNDPEQQKKMLANRKISGTYQWSDRNPKHQFTYTGSYERDFLIFLDRVMDWDPNDLFAPSPHVYQYSYEGKIHFYIPDFFIPSLDLEIEIKDGGDNPNNHPKIQMVDKEKERLKDEIFTTKGVPFKYLKISNKNHQNFLEYLMKVKEETIRNKK